MRILVVTLGSIGDLMPFIVVGTALRDRGHDVIFASNAGYEMLVRSAGFAFQAIWDRPPSLASLDDAIASDPQEAWRRVHRDMFVAAERPAFDFIAREAGRGPCVILASWSAYGASLAHEKLAIPLCRAYLSPKALSEEPSRGTSDDGLRRAGFFPEWFAARQPGWPDIALTGFAMFPDRLIPALPLNLERFLGDGEPPIVITPGSFARGAADFFRESLAACGMLNRRAILLTPYPEQIPPRLPPTAMHFQYVALQRLLSHAAALICHGGIGTLAQGLRAGIPQLIVPAFFDQADNGRHVERLGTGAAIPPGAYTAAAAADRIAGLLRSKTIQRSCARVRDSFTGEDPVQEICNLAESLS